MTMKLSESVFEAAVLSWFDELGYVVRNGLELSPDHIDPERTSYSQVILAERLKQQLICINSQVPILAIEDALRQIQNPNLPSLIQSNRQFHRWLRDGIPVQFQRDNETVGDFVHLVDFEDIENNDWLVVDQFTIHGPHHNNGRIL